MEIRNIERKDGKVSFQVLVDGATFERAVNAAYLKARKSISVPGFRKGKAPRMVVEGMYGTGVFYDDAVDSLALEAFQAGLAEAKDRTVGDPAITNYNVADDKTLSIDFEAALYPEVTLGAYKGIEAYKASAAVTDEDVDKELENVRKRNARIVTVDRPAQDGDTVKIDYDGYLDGERFEGGKDEGHDLTLGSGQFVPGFEEQLVGCKAGDEKDLDITFPADYPHEPLAGKAVVFKVKVHEVKETQLPELDDEFAKDASEFDTLDAYKADIRANLEKARTQAVEDNFRGLVLEKAAANATVDIPPVMVDQRVDRVIADYARNCAMQGMKLEQYFGMLGIDEQTFRQYVRPRCESEVRTELVLEKIADAEQMEATAEEIEKEYQSAADTYGMEIDKIKAAVASEYIEHDVKARKAADFLVENAVATDKPEEPEEAPAKKPAKKSTRKTTKKPAAEPAEAPAADETPAEKTEEAPAKKPARKSTKKPAEKPEE
jgi:trigger factor